MLMRKVIDKYKVVEQGTKVDVSIVDDSESYVLKYNVNIPKISDATKVYLENVKDNLLRGIIISKMDILDEDKFKSLKSTIFTESRRRLRSFMPNASDKIIDYVASTIVREMLGLGSLEFLLRDDNLEEICINGSKQPVWVYHRKYGWLETNLKIENENMIRNYAASIGRRVGRQITIQNPILDAHLLTGDRINATLLPISSFGNTITIRKFSRKPWTIVDLINNRTIDYEPAAFLWLAIQYELNIIISGGTGAGKTSFLNALSSFFPQNQRIVSIEQTREITLPSYFQWVPMVVREETSEGKGGVGMLDLMVNSLRMRPDRIIVGEIRRAEEAQVLFEAMHTGHSVYATLHAETGSETLRRLTNKPIEIPPVVLNSLHLVAVMYRDRRSGIRRLFEVVEILPTERKSDNPMRYLYRWHSFKDKIIKGEDSIRCFDTIQRFTRMTEEEIKADLKEKIRVLKWLVKNNINTVNSLGAMISAYYKNKKEFMKKVK